MLWEGDGYCYSRLGESEQEGQLSLEERDNHSYLLVRGAENLWLPGGSALAAGREQLSLFLAEEDLCLPLGQLPL